jgi:hypothetical protein
MVKTVFWGAANTRGEPAPQAAGSAESFLVTGLKDYTTYYFALVTFDKAGNASNLSNVVQVSTTRVEGGGEGDVEFTLQGNSPNPFNPSTVIGYFVPQRMASAGNSASVRIYAADGRLVRTLEQGRARAGIHRISWNGKDGKGGTLGSGIYLCRLTLGGIVKEKRMALVK